MCFLVRLSRDGPYFRCSKRVRKSPPDEPVGKNWCQTDIVSLRGGDRGEAQTKTTTRRAAMDSQSAIEIVVQGSCVAVNQQMRNCKQVSFRLSACRAARPRSLGPPLQSRRFPSFPVVSRRFSSFLVVSRAFRLGSASISGSLTPRSCKAGPIQAEWPQRRAPRQECGAPLATFNCFQITIAPNCPW